MKRNVTKCASDGASVHTGNASCGTIFAPEQYCSASLSNVERPVLDRFLNDQKPSLNTSVAAEIATEPLISK